MTETKNPQSAAATAMGADTKTRARDSILTGRGFPTPWQQQKHSQRAPNTPGRIILARIARAIFYIAKDLQADPDEFSNFRDMLIATLFNLAHDIEAILRDECPRCGGTLIPKPRPGRRRPAASECECVSGGF